MFKTKQLEMDEMYSVNYICFSYNVELVLETSEGTATNHLYFCAYKYRLNSLAFTIVEHPPDDLQSI